MNDNIYLTADTHFSHQNIIKYCKRPEDWAEQTFKNLKAVLNGESILIHLGDVCLGREEYNHRTYIKSLPGRKWLTVGNHDSKSDIWYLKHGWDFVCRSFSIKRYGKKILFSHKPYKDTGYDLNIHGHQHNNVHRSDDEEILAVKNDKQVLVSIELNDYKPVKLRDLVEGYEAETEAKRLAFQDIGNSDIKAISKNNEEYYDPQ